MRTLLGGHGGVHSRQLGFYLVAVAKVVGYDGVDLLKREALLRLPHMHAGESDPLPRRCFRLWDHRFTVRSRSPRAVSSGPSTGRATLIAHSGGTLPLASRARCVEHPLRGVCGERVCPASVAVSPARSIARLFYVC